MGIFKNIFKPRDSRRTELLDQVTFLMGGTTAGKTVTEKKCYANDCCFSYCACILKKQ